MKVSLIILNLLIFTLCTNAQQPFRLPDSLQIRIKTPKNNFEKAAALMEAGEAYYGLYTTAGYDKAAEYFNEALQLIVKNNIDSLKPYIYNSIASVYDALGDEHLPKALEFYIKSNKEMLAKSKDTGIIAGSFNLIASVQQRLGNKDGCKEALEKSMTYLQTPKYKKGFYNTNITAAFYMSKLDAYEDCKKYFSQTSKDTAVYKNRSVPARKYLLLTQMYLYKKEKNYTGAMVYGKIALSESNNKSDSLEVLSNLTDFASNAGNYNEAYFLLKQEFNVYKAILNADAIKSTENNLLKTELFLKEENAKLLQKQKNLQQKLNYWLLAGILLTAILAFIIFRFALQRRKQNKILQLQNEEKAILLGEIHHRVKNNLDMLQSMLQLQMRTYKDDEMVQQALIEANNRIQSISLLHKQLYSGNLANTDTNLYFTEIFATVFTEFNNSRTNIIEHKLEVEHIQMPPGVILPLALLINEWITNSVKYAFTKEQSNALIKLEIKKEGVDNLSVIYLDNGQNLENNTATASSTGFGSRLINSLVKQLKGNLTTSQADDGWKYVLTLPFHE